MSGGRRDECGAGARLGDRFVVEEVAGRGGMGTVYRARDERTGDRVAIKVLDDGEAADAERFAREAQLLAEVSHPAVVAHRGSGVTADGRPYLVMEWLRGCDLAARLEEGPLGLNEVLALAGQLARGLASVHERGIVHRDIKPSNLFLVDGDPAAVRLVDFGIARRASRATRLTRTGMMVGTVGYMAPEQIRAQRDLDARADLFSLGCVLYECLTGAPPFRGASPVAVLAKVLVEAVPPTRVAAPEVPLALAELIDRLLAKQPAGRPRGAVEVGRLLAEVEAAIDHEDRAGRPLRNVEQRVVCTIMLGPRLALDSERRVELAETAAAHGGRATQVDEGTVVITFDAGGGAADRAARAALCASALRAWLTDGGVAITSGYSYATEHAAAGSALDRASRLVLAPGAGVKLDELTASLLGDRFRIEAAGDVWLLGPEQRAATGPRAAGVLLGRAAPCVGRKKELALLAATADEVEEDGVCRVVLVTGPPGVGKSRVAGELLASMRGRGWLELEARATPLTAAAAGAIARQLVRGARGPREGEGGADRFAAIAARVGSLDVESPERVAEFLGELVGAPSPNPPSPQLRAARADPNVMQRWLAASFREWLAGECARRPVMCVLEDLHWADASSIALLFDALEHLDESPLFVLAMARPEVRERFGRRWHGASVHEISLGHLTRAAARKLVSRGLPDASAGVVEDVVARGGGNPFFLEELVRAVVAGNTALPDTVLAVAQERIERQDAEARRALRAASVFGERCWVGGVASLLGTGANDATEALLEDLARAELLRRCDESRFSGETEYAFRHALLCDAAYAMLPENERPTAHRRAARWLETAGEVEPAVLVEHWDRAGDAARTMRWLRATIAAARAGGDSSSLLEHARRGLDLACTPEERAPFRLHEAFAGALECDYQSVLDARAEVMPHLAVGSLDWCTMLGLIGYAGMVLGDAEAVGYTSATLAQSLEAIEPSGPAALALTTASAGVMLIGGREAYRPLGEALRSMNERRGDDDLVVRGWWLHLSNSAATYTRDGSAAEVLAMVERERRCFETAGDSLAFSIATGWSVYCLAPLGAVERADERAAAAAALERGDRIGVAGRFGLVGAAMARLSAEPEEARERAAELLRRQSRSIAAVPRILLAHTALGRGDLSDVAGHIEALEASPYLPGRVAAAGFRGALALAAGDAERALSEVGAAFEGIEGSLSLPITRTFLHCLRIDVLQALGLHEEAAAAARIGRARLEAIAGGLEPGLRPGFWARAPFVAESARRFDEILGAGRSSDA